MSYLEEGFPTIYTLADAPNIKMKEKTVTPPSVSMGGRKNITNMRNTAWRTGAPKKLKSTGQMQATVTYDPAVLEDIIAQAGNNQLITITYPDASTWAFWGWIEEFNAGQLEEGEEGTATVIFEVSNRNNAGAEVPPVYAAAA